MRRLSIKQSAFLLVACLTLGLAFALWRQGLPFLYAYLIGISLIALLCYGFDKYQSMHRGFRIPEVVLHVLALAGGSPGALLGQQLFRHKTAKPWFRLWLYGIVVVQVIGLGLYLAYARA